MDEDQEIPEFEVVEVQNVKGFNWINILYAGIIFTVLGLGCFLFPNIPSKFVMALFGSVFIILSVVIAIFSFAIYPDKRFLSSLLMAFLSLFFGIFLLTPAAIRLLSLSLIIYLFVKGIGEVVLGIKYRKANFSVGFFINGGLAILTAIVLSIIGYEDIKDIFGYIIALSLISTGIFCIVSSIRYKKNLII